MARKFVGRRGFPRRPLIPVKWTGNGITALDSVAAGVSDTLELVVPGDYTGGTTTGAVEAGGATLLRIRAQINLASSVLGGIAWMYIIVHGFNEPTFVATDALTITSGDVIWQDHYYLAANLPVHVDVDIKSKRRLENDRVIFVLSAIAQTITWTSNFRCLIRSSA